MPKKKSSARQKAARRTLHSVMFISFGLLLLLAVLIWQGLYRPLPFAQGQILRIEQGQTYNGLIANLADKHQLRLPLLAKLYQRLFIHQQLKAGAYQMDAGLDIRQLMQRLSDGRLAQMSKVTLIEGSTFAQLKQNLARNEGLDQSLNTLTTAQFLAKIDPALQHPEGWFAPDTYYFAQGEQDIEVLKLLYQKQRKILQQEWQQRAQNLPYKTPYEALIMASIVEKETGIGGERADVAAVFVNRLRIGMRLQTDPTVIYGMGDAYDGNIRKKDLLTPTAYNTYTIDRLPPTPIAMPSRAAIHAALHPSDSKALYFVASGNGGHVFSQTLAEHNAAVARYLAVLRQKKAAGG